MVLVAMVMKIMNVRLILLCIEHVLCSLVPRTIPET